MQSLLRESSLRYFAKYYGGGDRTTTQVSWLSPAAHEAIHPAGPLADTTLRAASSPALVRTAVAGGQCKPLVFSKL